MHDSQPSHQDKKDDVHLQPIVYPIRLPQELVDLVIDSVSDRHLDWIGAFRNLDILRACALVAKGWLKRAQRRIFQWIELPDTTTLYRLVDVLRASPHLASYVEVLSLSRRGKKAYMGYSAGCVEVLFSTVLGGLLPKLRCVAMDIRPEGKWTRVKVERDAQGEIIAVLRDTSHSFFPCLPLHPRFPLRLSAFSSLEELDLGFVVFQNFYDFARTLYHCKQLRILHCVNVEWTNLGSVMPPFMTRSTPQSKSPFLPLLERFSVSDVVIDVYNSYERAHQIVEIGGHGAERLLAGLALTASLRQFTVTISYVRIIQHYLRDSGTAGASTIVSSPSIASSEY